MDTIIELSTSYSIIPNKKGEIREREIVQNQKYVPSKSKNGSSISANQNIY